MVRNEFSVWRKYAFGWITLAFLIFSLLGHWLFGWWTYVNEQVEFHHPIQFAEYATRMTRDTLENWQSEFLQLLWQVCGLAYLLYVGSPQSKEADDRQEAKLDALLKLVGSEGQKALTHIESKYPR